jgi:hypothetical protein
MVDLVIHCIGIPVATTAPHCLSPEEVPLFFIEIHDSIHFVPERKGL